MKNEKITIEKICEFVEGIETLVPTISGQMRQYVNLDNAASTPTFTIITKKVNEFLKWYSNVHRGTGFKSRLCSKIFEEAREIISKFVGADKKSDVILFCKNTTEGINKLANRYPFELGDIVLTSVMEHHSNELPWRKVAEVIHIGITEDGKIDETDFKQKLSLYGKKIKLVAISGASNVTGYVNPIHTYAKWVHEIGAEIFIDAAQLAPHRKINMHPINEDEKIDYLAFSAHKLYAPFGIGVLIGKKNIFEIGAPEIVGGGAVDIVTLEDAYWTSLPDKEEAGTPDIVGVVALAQAILIIEEIGWEKIVEHENELTRYAFSKLKNISKIKLIGDTENLSNRLGVLSFNIEGMPHGLVASILSFEFAIGTRNGCFCAHPYVKCLLNVSKTESDEMEKNILNRNRSNIPGFVRASLGIYSSKNDVDELANALDEITKGNYKDGYYLDVERGEYLRKDFNENFSNYFKLI
ncbi:MAG: aminotransferase class V-fold PLP-dependent enzyme [Bacteroidota bacterium]